MVISLVLIAYRRNRLRTHNAASLQRPPPPLPLFLRAVRKAHSTSLNRLDPDKFFDFLKNRSDSEILTAMTGDIALHSAVALRFVPRDQRARILSGFSPKERVHIESMSEKVPKLSSDEFVRVADDLRRKIASASETETTETPSDSDEKFWDDTLSRSTAKEILLNALERTRPDLKALTDRYRIRLDEVPALPRAQLQSALTKLTDRELTTAMAGCPRLVVESLLGALSPPRRMRVMARLKVQGELPKALTGPAVRTLLRRFHDAVT